MTVLEDLALEANEPRPKLWMFRLKSWRLGMWEVLTNPIAAEVFEKDDRFELMEYRPVKSPEELTKAKLLADRVLVYFQHEGWNRDEEDETRREMIAFAKEIESGIYG